MFVQKRAAIRVWVKLKRVLVIYMRLNWPLQRRQWLAEALSGMAGNDLVKQMAECLQVVQDSKNTDERLEALDTLQEMCEDMDLAKGVSVLIVSCIVLSDNFFSGTRLLPTTYLVRGSLVSLSTPVPPPSHPDRVTLPPPPWRITEEGLVEGPDRKVDCPLARSGLAC